MCISLFNFMYPSKTFTFTFEHPLTSFISFLFFLFPCILIHYLISKEMEKWAGNYASHRQWNRFYDEYLFFASTQTQVIISHLSSNLLRKGSKLYINSKTSDWLDCLYETTNLHEKLDDSPPNTSRVAPSVQRILPCSPHILIIIWFSCRL